MDKEQQDKFRNKECPHGMNPAWCAICLKQDEKEDDEYFTFKGIIDAQKEKNE